MPTADQTLRVAQTYIDVASVPRGSHHNQFTQWYHKGDIAWCAIYVSWVLAHAGFSADDGITLSVPGVEQTTPKGWSYVPYLLNMFRDAGRVTSTPEPGDVIAFFWYDNHEPDHTGFVESVNPDGSYYSIEGNHNDAVNRVLRQRWITAQFCKVPYAGSAVPVPLPPLPAGVPPFPGYCSFGSVDDATRQVQQRLSDRGWRLTVDGNFGGETLAVTRAFQREKLLEVDGVAGPLTWIALWTAPITP